MRTGAKRGNLGVSNTSAASCLLESLEPRQLLSLTVATPIGDLSGTTGGLPATINVANVFSDTQSAVRIQTLLGNVDVLLYDADTPLTVANFLRYVNDGLYDNTFIHRSISGFVVQGGGYKLSDNTHISTFAAVQNEFHYSNVRGTVAMAKLGGDPNSATSEWFFNLADNSANLDAQNGGFTVFGTVIGSGMTVVDSIASLSTQDYSATNSAFTDVPVQGNNRVSVSADLIPKFAASGLSWITLSVLNNTNAGLVTASLSGGTLNLAYTAGASGTASITLRATDLAGNTKDETFDVTVQAVSVTNKNSDSDAPIITGTVSSGMTGLNVTVNNVTYTQASGDITVNNNTWSLQLPALPDGAYTVTAQVLDTQANPITAQGQLLIDTAAPTVTIDNGQLPRVIRADTTLTGTYDDVNIASVVVTLNNGQGGTHNFTATLDAQAKTWSATIVVSGVADGSYSVSAKATDQAGNDTTANGAGNITVDKTAPTAAFNAGQLPLRTKIDQAFAGTFVDGDVAGIVLKIDDGAGHVYQFPAVLDQNAKTWSATVAVAGAIDAAYTLSLVATDQVGNAATVQGGTFTIDTTGSATFSNTYAKIAAPTITGTVEQNVASLEITVSGVTYTLANGDITILSGAWSLALPALADGSYPVSVAVTDDLGNSGNANATLVIDTTAPTVALDNGQLPVRTNQNVTLTGTFADANIASVVVTLTGQAGGPYTYPAVLDTNAGTWSATVPAANVSSGSYTVRATATDLATNAASADGAGSLVMDRVAEVTAGNQASNVAAATITGTVGNDVATLEVTVDNVTYTLANGDIDLSGVTWSLTLPALADGTYPVGVACTDDLGNANNATGQLIVDTVAPTVTINNGQLPATIQAGTTLAGTYDDLNIGGVVVTLDGGNGYTRQFNAVLDTNAKTWTATISIANVKDGVYTVSATATDVATNSATAAGQGQLTLVTLSVTVDSAVGYSGTPLLSGTVSSSHSTIASVTVVVGGQTLPATVSGTTWTVQVPQALADNTYDVQVTAVDALGSTAQDSTADELIVRASKSNQSMNVPVGLGAVNAPATWTGMNLSDSAEIHWYTFTLGTAGIPGSQVRLTYSGQQAGRVRANVYGDPYSGGPIANGMHDSGSETVSLEGLPAGTYYLRVYSFGTISYTLTITPTGAPATVTNVAASDAAYNAAVHVTWDVSVLAGSYDVYRHTANNSGAATKLNAAPITVPSYADKTAAAGTTYYYWVVATNSVGNSAFSAGDTGSAGASSKPSITGSATGALANATMSAATSLGTASGQVAYSLLGDPSDLGWYKFTLLSTGTPNANATLDFLGDPGDMKILLYSDPFNYGPDRYSTVHANQAQISLEGLTIGTYYVRVYSYVPHSYTLTVTGPVAPVAATGVQAGNGTYSNGVGVSWNAAFGASSYSVWRNTADNSAAATNLGGTVYGTSFYDRTAVQGTTYYYWVKASNSAGTSGFSLSDSGTVGAGGMPSILSESASNGSPSSAMALGAAAGQRVLGSASDRDDLDWFSFTLGAAGNSQSVAALDFTGAAGGVRAILYSDPFSSGPTRFGESDKDSESISLDGLPAGTYYLRLYGRAGTNYALRVVG